MGCCCDAGSPGITTRRPVARGEGVGPLAGFDPATRLLIIGLILVAIMGLLGVLA